MPTLPDDRLFWAVSVPPENDPAYSALLRLVLELTCPAQERALGRVVNRTNDSDDVQDIADAMAWAVGKTDAEVKAVVGEALFNNGTVTIVEAYIVSTYVDVVDTVDNWIDDGNGGEVLDGTVQVTTPVKVLDPHTQAVLDQVPNGIILSPLLGLAKREFKAWLKDPANNIVPNGGA